MPLAQATGPMAASTPMAAAPQTSLWRQLHPILGWVSLGTMVCAAFIGPALKQSVDGNVDPPLGLNIAHVSFAGVSALTWAVSLSALLAHPPEGKVKPTAAHKWLGLL